MIFILKNSKLILSFQLFYDMINRNLSIKLDFNHLNQNVIIQYERLK